MSESLEVVYIDPDYTPDHSQHFGEQVAYVRKDLSDKRIAELEARNAALGEAVAHATKRFTNAENALGRIEALNEKGVLCGSIARTTLAAIKEAESERTT